MLEEREQLFLDYWATNRERESKLTTQLLYGVPMGLIFALPLFLIVFSSRYWYKRADMALNASFNPWVLILAVFLIVVFVAIFYKRHQWDRKEQQYLEIKRKLQQSEKASNAAIVND